MPRARINAEGEEAVLPKLKTRKPRAVSADGDIKVVRKRAAPRPRVVSTDTELAVPMRKAPTAIASTRTNRTRKSKTLFTVLGMCLLLGGVGVGIGFMDRGSIDVVAVVNERNEKINKGEIRDETGQVVTQTLEVQNADSRPNGGLKMGDAPAVVPTVPEVTPTEATSTPIEVSTSTTETVPLEGESAVPEPAA